MFGGGRLFCLHGSIHAAKIGALAPIKCQFNIKQQIPSDIPTHNLFIPAENLKSQVWLNQINEWTKNQKMVINSKKTKTMIFNFTDKFKFSTRLALEEDNIEVIRNTKLLGTEISDVCMYLSIPIYKTQGITIKDRNGQ